jgi:hypothetical protein
MIKAKKALVNVAPAPVTVAPVASDFVAVPMVMLMMSHATRTMAIQMAMGNFSREWVRHKTWFVWLPKDTTVECLLRKIVVVGARGGSLK